MVQLNQTRAYLIKYSVYKKIFNMLLLTPGESFLLGTINIEVGFWGVIDPKGGLRRLGRGKNKQARRECSGLGVSG